MNEQLSLFDASKFDKRKILYYVYPSLIDEWCYEKNNLLGLNPLELTVGSTKKAWWICPKGHEYFSSIYDRTRGAGCAICRNKKVLKGYNDLATKNPNILHFWNYERNSENNIYPEEYTTISGKKVWWICEYGHEWQTTIAHVSYGSRCPECSKGLSSSFPEQAIFYYLKKLNYNCINRYKLNNKYEIDIYISDKKIGIEYDGYKWHDTSLKEKRDIYKHEQITKEGIKLYRVKEKDSRKKELNKGNFKKVDDVYYINSDDELALTKVIKHLVKLINNTSIDVDIDRDRIDIFSLYLYQQKENSVLNNKKIIEYWNYKKNKNIKPSMLSRSSGKKVWWKCKKGHSFEATIHSMDNGLFCPVCKKIEYEKVGFKKEELKKIKYLKNKYDYKRINEYPQLMREWNYEKNNELGLDPSKIFSGSSVKAWWKCEKGHEFFSNVGNRTKGVGCQKCARELVARKKYKPVCQYDKDNNLIQIYESIKSAKEKTGIIHINDVCYGIRKTAGGYVWKFK